MRVNVSLAWDMMGHLLISREYAQHIWPWTMGWSHLNFGGYALGYLYPPLAHWMVASLGQIIDIELSFRIYLFCFIFLFPFSFKYFIFSIHKESSVARLSAYIWGLVVFFVYKSHLGGDYFGVIRLGLVTQLPALSLYFFYVGSLCRIDSKWSFRDLCASSLMVGLCILTHSFTGIAAILSAAYVLFLKRSYVSFYSLCLHGVAILGVSAAWMIPYLSTLSFQGGSSASGLLVPLLFSALQVESLSLIIFTLLYCSIIFLRFYRKNITYPLTFKVANYLLVAICLLGFFFWLLENYFKISVPFHTYRFIVFSIYLSAAYVGWVMVHRTQNNLYYYLGFVSLYFLSLASCLKMYSENNLESNVFSALSSVEKKQTLVVTSLENPFLDEAPHYISNYLNLLNVPTLNGLLVESSLRSPWIHQLMQRFDADVFVWGKKADRVDPRSTESILRDYGVEQLILNKKTKLKWLEFVREIPIEFKFNDLSYTVSEYLYRVPANYKVAAKFSCFPRLDKSSNSVSCDDFGSLDEHSKLKFENSYSRSRLDIFATILSLLSIGFLSSVIFSRKLIVLFQ